MSDLVWILECKRCGLYERGIQKTPLLQKYKKHVKDGCLDVKEVFAERLDQRFTI